jgi:hypothetical protein
MTISNAFESQVARELETKITNFNKKTDFDSLFQGISLSFIFKLYKLINFFIS